MLMKARNLNSLFSCRLTCSTVMYIVGLLSVALSGGTLVLSLDAQNESVSGQSANLSQVAAKASEVKPLGATKAATQSQMTSSPVAAIEQVHLSGKGQQTQVRVDGTGPLTYNAFRLNQPDRLVIDFSGAVVRVHERSLSSSFYPVSLVRIGQFQPDVARVVIEIAEQLPYTIAASKNAVTVVFNPVAVAGPRVTTKKEIRNIAATGPLEPEPSVAPHSVENRQEARSLSESSMQSAMANPSHWGAELSTAGATDLQTVQARTQPVTLASVPQPGEKNAHQSIDVVAVRQPAVIASQTVSGYVLGPDDEIVIRGIDDPEISEKPDMPVLIGTNGDITLPLIGRVKAGGLTVEQLEAELTARFKEFIQEPQISVTVTEFRSQPVSVFGAVTKPGIVQLTGSANALRSPLHGGRASRQCRLNPHGNAPSDRAVISRCPVQR